MGKQKLIEVKKNGISKKLMGVKIDLDKINLSQAIDVTVDSKRIGEIRSAVYSPTFNQVIAIAMINKPYFEEGTKIDIVIDNVTHTGALCNIPFV